MHAVVWKDFSENIDHVFSQYSKIEAYLDGTAVEFLGCCCESGHGCKPLNMSVSSVVIIQICLAIVRMADPPRIQSAGSLLPNRRDLMWLSRIQLD
jgi:hypothetical protein